MAQQDLLDRGAGEVLTVDAQPGGGTTGEPDPALCVTVCEVARPVHAAAHPLCCRLFVVVVAGELARARRVDQLADALVEIDHPAVRVELGARALLARLGVVDGDAVGRPAQRARWRPFDLADDDGVLGRAEAVDHVAAEPFAEGADVAVAGLVAEHESERVVGVVGLAGVARMYVSGLPTYDAYVAPNLRTSARNSEAENFSRSATVAPLKSAGAHPAMTALEWNSGIAT